MNRVTAAIDEYSHPWIPPISDTRGPSSRTLRDERRMLEPLQQLVLEHDGRPLDHVASSITSGTCTAGRSLHAK